MIIREAKDTDITAISEWFEKRRFPQPVIEAIAPSFGLIAEQDGVQIACVWVYTTGRSIAFMEWMATNPMFPQDFCNAALDAILEHLKQMCKVSEPKIRALCLHTRNKSLAFHLESKNFKKEDKYMRLMWTLK